MVNRKTFEDSDIAIVGMSALFPGARCIEDFWQNILNKVDQVKDAPDEWAESYLQPEVEDLDRIYTRKVGLLGELAEFNPLEFGVLPTTVPGSEPDHFLALRLARDAILDAGYEDKGFDGEKTGVILGRGATPNRGSITGFQYGLVVGQTVDLLRNLFPELSEEYLDDIRKELKSSLPPLPAEASPGLVSNVAVGRIANRLDLRGPSYVIDAACASSLISVEAAIKELRSGGCDMMVAGGVQASMPPQIYMLFCRIDALSRTKIRPFDQNANGTVLGEGVGFLVLKRLEDAEKDGNKIYAVLKDIGLSSDGKALGLLAPRLEGEILALERAYQEANIEPDTVDLIEAHGTGIQLGDETEIKTLRHVFGSRGKNIPRCAIGSVKSMIGHCIPASGIASLIKTSLALYHKVIPPTLCENVRSELNLEKTPFYVNTDCRPWIHGHKNYPRRAGVNAFGFGGINAHAILEEYPDSESHNHKQLPVQWPSELFVFSDREREGLIRQMENLQSFLQGQTGIKLSDLSFTLAGNNLEAHCLCIIANDIQDLEKKISKAIEKLSKPNCNTIQTRNGIFYSNPTTGRDLGKTVFLFPGEGSQYPNMLADLCQYFPQVRSWFDLSDATFDGIWESLPSRFVFPPPTGLTKSEKDFLSKGLMSVDVATEVVFTAGMAMYEILNAFGIQSHGMIGHSTGEYTALTASGLFKTTNRMNQIKLKRYLNKTYKEFESLDKIPRGVLLSVGAMDPKKLDDLIKHSKETLYLAMDNCPNQKVLFSRDKKIEETVQVIKDHGGICQTLPFDRAYHTPLFDEMRKVLQTYYQEVPIGKASTPLYSCATCGPFPKKADQVRSLAAKQWSTPVRFQETIERLYEENFRTFIEVGPNNNLTSFVEDILRKRDFIALASNQSSRSGIEQLQTLLGRLLSQGIKLDLAPLYQYRTVKKLQLSHVKEEQQKVSNYNPVLNLLLPKVKLSTETIKEIREKISTPFPATTERNFKDKIEKEEKRDAKPSSSGSGPLKNETIKNEKREEIVNHHFELMKHFLSNQQRVTETYLARKKVAQNDNKTSNSKK